MNFFSSDPLGNRAQRGFRQRGLCKIWFSKNLDTKILKTGDLETRFLASRSVTRSVMIAQSGMPSKVRCHNEVVERRSVERFLGVRRTSAGVHAPAKNAEDGPAAEAGMGGRLGQQRPNEPRPPPHESCFDFAWPDSRGRLSPHEFSMISGFDFGWPTPYYTATRNLRI